MFFCELFNYFGSTWLFLHYELHCSLNQVIANEYMFNPLNLEIHSKSTLNPDLSRFYVFKMTSDECGQVLEACSSSEICVNALSQVYDVCESPQQCTDTNYTHGNSYMYVHRVLSNIRYIVRIYTGDDARRVAAVEWIDVVSKLNNLRGRTKDNALQIKYR